MQKPMYVWSGSAWVSVATEVESLAGFATQSYADNTPGMKLVVPTSVAVGSGSGSVATQGTVTFSGASSVSINGCFTSTYDNYMILIDSTFGTTSGTMQARMRLSGTDNSESLYVRQFMRGTSTSVATNTDTKTFFDCGDLSNTYRTKFKLELNQPAAAVVTTAQSNGSHAGYINTTFLVHNKSVAYDGITIYPDTSTLTGTVRIYGMKNG
jgi:hypothetical protein